MDENFLLLNTSRTTFNRACRASRSARVEALAAASAFLLPRRLTQTPPHFSWSSRIARGFTLAVAEIVPAPPLRILASRNDSLPTKTSNASLANASRKVLVLFQSPELFFMPAIAFG